MSDSNADPRLQGLLDREAIRDVLSRYCRGLDRMDRAMAESVWWADGTAFYDGIFEGTGHEFVEWVWQAHAGMERHSHQITNVLIDLDGDVAKSEAYVTVVLWTLADSDGKQAELIGRGRYLDRWSKRGAAWAIDHRIHLLDMSTVFPLARNDVSAGSRRDANDLSFEFIPAC